MPSQLIHHSIKEGEDYWHARVVAPGDVVSECLAREREAQPKCLHSVEQGQVEVDGGFVVVRDEVRLGLAHVARFRLLHRSERDIEIERVVHDPTAIREDVIEAIG